MRSCSPHRLCCALLLSLGIPSCTDVESPQDVIEAREAIPEIPYCDGIRSWPDVWASEETRAMEIIDDLRVRGIECGALGRAPTVPTLRLNGALTCAARVHAVAMAEQQSVGHTTPDEIGTEQRVEAVGYDGDVLEHLAAGPLDATEAVLSVWRHADESCADLMSAKHVDVGIGFVGATEDGSEFPTYWVVVMGDPPGA